MTPQRQQHKYIKINVFSMLLNHQVFSGYNFKKKNIILLTVHCLPKYPFRGIQYTKVYRQLYDAIFLEAKYVEDFQYGGLCLNKICECDSKALL